MGNKREFKTHGCGFVNYRMVRGRNEGTQREQVKAAWELRGNAPKGRYRPRVQERLRRGRGEEEERGRTGSWTGSWWVETTEEDQLGLAQEKRLPCKPEPLSLIPRTH